MGQILQKDKIGAISEAAGDITLQASVLTIGGQQYTTGILSRTIATDVTLVANTRYQIYAVISAGVVVLRVSINENSVGPAGFNGWGLVGSFYSNGSSAFGTFKAIKGNGRVSNIKWTDAATNGTGADDNVVVWTTQTTNDDTQVAFSIEDTASTGTKVTVLKEGTLTINVVMARSASQEMWILRNAVSGADITPPAADQVAAFTNNINMAGVFNMSWGGKVVPGDEFLVLVDSGPSSSTQNLFDLTFVEEVLGDL